MNDQHGVWVYAISDPGREKELSPLTGVAGAKVSGAAAGGLTVLVSHVDLAEFGAEALRQNMENLDWLEDVARAHHGVIDAAARQFPVLPARFATVYSSDAAMSAALAGQGEELRAALDRVGGCVEMGVKAYAAAAGAGTGTDTATAGTGGAGAEARNAGAGGTGGAGMAYLKRRRAQLSAAEDSRRATAEGARALHAQLSEHAGRSMLYPPQSPTLTGIRAPMLLNASYLLDADGSAAFAAVVTEAAAGHPELQIDLSGPWPPYSFTAQDS